MKRVPILITVLFIMPSLHYLPLAAQVSKQLRPQRPIAHQMANLKVGNVVVSPAHFNDGDTVTIRYQVTNNGTVTTKRFISSFRIAGYLQKNHTVRSLNKGKSVTLQHTFKARCGSQQWSIIADSGGVVPESNEQDNRWKKTFNPACPGLPYLAVHSVRFTHPFGLNDIVHFTYTVENRGKCWAPATVTHFIVNGQVKAVGKVRALHRFEKVTLSHDWKAVCSGTLLKWQIISDALNKVQETNEAHKKGWEMTRPCPAAAQARKPDLTIEKVEIVPSPKQLFANERVKVKVTIRNLSHDCQTGESGPCILFWNIRGQQKPVYSKLERIDIPKIPSACYGINSNFKVIEREYRMGLYPQPYVFTLEVDHYDRVKEGKENNNKRVITFIVKPEKKADLAIVSLYSPDPTRYIGQKITVRGTVKNIGLKNSRACLMEVKCYKDKYRKTNVKELKPGDEFRFSFSFRWATRGSKKCEVWVDKANKVSESNKANNYRVYNKIRIK